MRSKRLNGNSNYCTTDKKHCLSLCSNSLQLGPIDQVTPVVFCLFLLPCSIFFSEQVIFLAMCVLPYRSVPTAVDSFHTDGFILLTVFSISPVQPTPHWLDSLILSADCGLLLSFTAPYYSVDQQVALFTAGSEPL